MTPRRLVDLDPKLEGTLDDGRLRFDCPFPGHTHCLAVHVHRAPYEERGGVRYWQATGASLDDLTLSPSINACTPDVVCWHGYIKQGHVE